MMCHITILQVMVVLVMVVLDFLEDKLAPGQSLVILLELVCVFTNALLMNMERKGRKHFLHFVVIHSAGVGPGGISPAQAKAAKYGILPLSLPRISFLIYKLKVLRCVTSTAHKVCTLCLV